MRPSRTKPAVVPPCTYTLKIVPERAPDVFRTAVFRGGQKLDDVHAFIQRAFELDNDHLYAFFMTNRAWDRENVFTPDPTYPWENASSVPLGRLGLEVGKRFMYLFDFGDELRHGCEVLAIGPVEEGKTYPVLLESQGTAPPQCPHLEDDGDGDDAGGEDDTVPELDPDLLPLLPELRAAALDADARMMEDVALTKEALDRDVALVASLLPALTKDPAQLWALDCESDECPISEWFLDVPFSLVEFGRGDEALAMCERVEEALAGEVSSYWSLHARILAIVGSAAKARELVDSKLADPEADLAMLDDAADVLVALDAKEEAERLTRRILEEVDRYDAPEIYFSAAERLKGLTGEAVERVDADRFDAPRPSWSSPPAAPVVTKKVGRNEPCPCGSGKKYKKCCLGKAETPAR